MTVTARRPDAAPLDELMMLTRRLVAVGLVAPVALMMLAAAGTAAVTPRLPDTIMLGTSLGSAPTEPLGLWAAILFPPVVTLLVAIHTTTAAVQLLSEDVTVGHVRLRASWGPLLAALLLLAVYLPTWQQARPAPGQVSLWVVVAAGAALVLSALLLIPGGAVAALTRAAPLRGAPTALRLSATQRVHWSAATRSITLLWVFITAAAVWALLPDHTVTGVANVTMGTCICVAVLAPWRVSVDAAGLRARPIIGRPQFRYPLDRIDRAEVIRISPLPDFGGWGLRWGARSRFGVITAGGPALAVHLRTGRTFVITVSDSETAASLINGLKEREILADD
ncbi:hypothetical protein GCM10022198_20010 [Klugiella xanthotipulae]|uniref:Uncharacterized protein n=1 Tax=Klugiella xanthotipulae TaxID=244735 RepID=A0A543I3W5_9MICO|nr:hypothetical protein [Klugiella xanthotipulae]TQM65265.1 hypothetical protein FB466_0056 [Klugiella xanthotipulae]